MANTKHEATFVGLDIGTSKVVCVVGLHQPDQATPSIIGIGTAHIAGVKRGVVVDVEETVSAITAALEEAERMSGIAIDRATINVDGAHLNSMNTSGVVAVARADREISADDLTRVEEATSNLSLDANRQIVGVIANAFHVDDQKDVSDPVGMNGIKLEMDAHIITGSAPAIKNLHNAVFRSGITINQQVVTPVAAARALLDTQKKELGSAVIHFGAETTGIVLFAGGKLLHTAVIPLGSNNVTKDLVYGLRTTQEAAEKLKLDHAVATKPKGKTNKKISLEQYGSAGNVYQHDIDTIVASRLEEIFVLVGENLQKAAKELKLQGLGGGIILTGGGANMPEMAGFVQQTLGQPVQLGKPKGYSGISEKINDPTYSVAIGLMLDDMDAPASGGTFSKSKLLSGPLNIVEKIKQALKGLLP